MRDEKRPKAKRARGRNALSDVDLQPREVGRWLKDVTVDEWAGCRGKAGMSQEKADKSLFRQPLALQRNLDFVEHHRIVDGGGHVEAVAIGDFLHRAAQDFA